MRYATPNRSAHRAVPAPHPMFLVRHLPRATGGQHRQHIRPRVRPRRRPGREPHQTMQLLTHGLGAMIVLGILLTLGFLILSENPRRAAAGPGIDTRAADPEPLSVPEAFPAGAAGYRVGDAVVQADCRLAVTGGLRPALAAYGCSQAVRAALTVPEGGYRVTAGILNLADSQGAAAVADRVRALVETGDGGFTEMSGGATAAGTPIGWRAHGHYLLYCVITGPGGEPVPAAGPALGEVTGHLLDDYLTEQVLDRRAAPIG
ncbi:hypothetical protein [Actinoplanes siamensis]|uniref:Uncharacterized protein n=1 Tax=Actinoplanes siamensis TaxID=1223317 RepID=A0A919N8F8_9ACTN|nr:hypothetical protein [Actinoplanes siamensis]GIF06194.1 hypothetical protein Asi03nite_37320 [Actinoplanes siamensis]